MPLMGNSP